MAIYVGQNNALLLKNDRSVVEFYKGSTKVFGYNNSKQGKIITADNVHPIEHRLKIKLSSDTLTDFSDIEVTRCGKNIFDADAILPTLRNPDYPSMYWKKQLDGSFYLSNVGVLKNKVWYENINDYKGQIAISVSVKSPEGKEGSRGLIISVAYTDGTSEAISCYHSEDFIKYTLISDQNKTVNSVYQSYGNGYNAFVKDIMIAYGNDADYEIYNPQITTANADGIVEGLISLPNMTLSTDNGKTNIVCEYISFG